MANTKVTGDLIASSTIATGNIADNAVTSAKISGITTAHITEGSNLYYTDTRARAAVSVSGNALSYNSSTGVITSNFEESPVFTGTVTINNNAPLVLNGTDPLISFQNGGSNHWQVGFENTQSDRFIFYDNNAASYRMVINSSGNVGIGTTSPNEKLDITGGYLKFNGGDYGLKGSAGLTYYATSEHYFYTGGTERMRIDGSGNSTFYGDVTISKAVTPLFKLLDTTNNISLLLGADDANTFIRSSSGANLYLQPGGSTALTLLSGGNVGIGTTSPSSKLKVVGPNTSSNPLVDLVASGTGSFQRGVRLLNGGMTAGDELMYAVGRSDNSRNMGQVYFHYAGDGSTSNRISMGLHSVDDVFNITGTGNVGIGTTSPGADLEVYTDAGGGNTLRLNTNFGGGNTVDINPYITGVNNGGMEIKLAGSQKLVMNPSGDVGIGVTSLSYKLQVAGTIGTANRLAIKETYFGYSSGYKVVQFGESAATKAISLGYDPSGNTSGSFSGNEILIPNNIRILAPAANNSGYYGLMMLNSSNKVLLGASNYLMESNYIMALDTATKNVGIGTDSPSEILHIKGGGSGPEIRLEGTWGSHYIRAYNDNWNFLAGGTVQAINIKNNGNVGIGTTSADSPLHVVGKVNTNRIVSSNLIMGNIRTNLTTTSYLLLVDLNVSAGYSMVGEINAASYTTYNVSRIYVRKNYNATTGVAVITGIAKSGSTLSVVDISHSSGRFIALKLTGDPEIDVMWTGYRLNAEFNSDGTIKTLTSGVTENSVYASY
jgi:hypothetical protein